LVNKRSFFYQAALLAASNTVLLLLGFAYRVLLGRLAGPEGLGVYTLVMQVYAIVMSVCVAGLCVASTRMTADLQARGDYAGIRRMTRFAVCCFLTLLGILTLPILSMREFIAGRILGDPRTADALWMVLICISLTGLENICKAIFHGARLVRYVAVSEVGEQLLRIAIVWMLLKRYMNGDNGFTAFLILLGMTLSEIYSVLFLGGSFASRIVRVKKGAAVKARGIRRDFLKIAVPSAFTSLLANVFSSIAVVIFPMRLLLAGYTRTEAVSALGLISGMVMPILLLPNAFVGALCTLLMPSISASLARKDFGDLTRKINKGIEVTGLFALPATALLLPFTPMLCALLFGQTAPPMLVVALAAEAVTGYYLVLTISILNGIGRQKQVLVFAGVGELFQLALVWVLSAMPSLHVYGYIFGVMCGDLFRMAAGFICLHRATGTRPRLFHAVVVPIACALVLYGAERMLFFGLVNRGMAVITAMLFSMLLCLLLYFVLLRLLGVRIVSYLQRVVFQTDASQKKTAYAAEQ
jgi:stage V sporulation protein B